MQLHQLKPNHKAKKPKRIGRGGSHGTYSGKGIKGQKARSGRKLKPIIRDFLKRYPKLRGHRLQVLPNLIISVNLKNIEKSFKVGEKVTPKSLVKKGLVSFSGNQIPKIKILGNEELTKSLVFQGLFFSKASLEKIKKAKGKII